MYGKQKRMVRAHALTVSALSWVFLGVAIASAIWKIANVLLFGTYKELGQVALTTGHKEGELRCKPYTKQDIQVHHPSPVGFCPYRAQFTISVAVWLG